MLLCARELLGVLQRDWRVGNSWDWGLGRDGYNDNPKLPVRGGCYQILSSLFCVSVVGVIPTFDFINWLGSHSQQSV